MFIIFCIYVISQFLNANTFDCESQRNCDLCIQEHFSCAWCKDKNYAADRCSTATNLQSSGCSDIENPTTKINLNDGGVNEYFEVKPQSIEIDVRSYDTLSYEISIKLIKNIPSDTVFVMDFSASMEPYWNNMKEFTLNFTTFLKLSAGARVGYTAYVDKIRFPVIYGDTYDPNALNRPFYYKIIHPLSDNPTSLYSAMSKQLISFNADVPEATINGILQSAVCDQIGWSTNPLVSKTIIVMTDAGSKSAGDGTTVGIFRPDNALCHVDSSLMDEYGLVYDYPSIGQTGMALKTKKISIIFVTSQLASSFYLAVKNSWKDINSHVTLLNGNQTSLLKLIEDARTSLNSQYVISFSSSDDFDITPTAICPKADPQNTAQSCYNVNNDQLVKFQITMKDHGNKNDGKINFLISNFVTIPLNYRTIRTCSCSENSNISPECNNNGVYRCGMCVCNTGWTGKECQCKSTDSLSTSTCLNPYDKTICSNRGICNECGRCICNNAADGKPYEGNYCECGRSCPQTNGTMCGGEERGKCVCNSCVCSKKYTGESCESINCEDTDLIEKCKKSPEDNQICSDSGKCICGACICNADRKGDFCEEKKIYQTCSQYEDFASCLAFNTPVSSTAKCNEDKYEGILVEDEQYDCITSLPNGCHIYFNYLFNSNTNETVVRVRKPDNNRDCPRPLNVAVIAGGLVAGIVLIGLLILGAYLLLTYFYYKNAYKKFIRERDNALFAGQKNPLYENPITETEKPT